MKVPFADLSRHIEPLTARILKEIEEIIARCEFVGGPRVKKFEAEFAEALGAKHCIAVANGTDALILVLKALGVGSGDEVVTQANSFIATSEAVSWCGARPVFVDADPATRQMDMAKLEELLRKSEKTGKPPKAVIVVHLYGRPADMDRIMALSKKYGFKVVEDCAQAHLATWKGKSVGTFGDFGCFSFYPGKNLGAFGDAGAVVTGDEILATRIRLLANHGRLTKYDHQIEGINSRLDPIQAAVLSIKLPYLAGWTEKRRALAAEYRKRLSGVRGLRIEAPDEAAEHSVHHLFVVEIPAGRENRESVSARLEAEFGVSCGVHYPCALPNLPAYAHLGYRPEDFPVATRLASEVLSLPFFPEMRTDELDHVVSSMRRCLEGVS